MKTKLENLLVQEGSPAHVTGSIKVNNSAENASIFVRYFKAFKAAFTSRPKIDTKSSLSEIAKKVYVEQVTDSDNIEGSRAAVATPTETPQGTIQTSVSEEKPTPDKVANPETHNVGPFFVLAEDFERQFGVVTHLPDKTAISSPAKAAAGYKLRAPSLKVKELFTSSGIIGINYWEYRIQKTGENEWQLEIAFWKVSGGEVPGVSKRDSFTTGEGKMVEFQCSMIANVTADLQTMIEGIRHMRWEEGRFIEHLKRFLPASGAVAPSPVVPPESPVSPPIPPAA